MKLRLLPSALSLLVLLLAAQGCPLQGDDDDDDHFLDVITSDERPSKRSEVISVADESSGTMLMFGGNEAAIVSQIPGATYLDETWVFEPGVGWDEVTDSGPHARGRHTAALDSENGRALVFGGRYRPEGQSGAYQLFDDLWAFDFTERRWTQLDDGSGPGPAARYYAQAAWSPTAGAFYVYGGLTNSDPLAFQRSSELWRWTESEGWEEVDTSGDAPSPRAFYGTTYDAKRDRMLLFAGQVGDFQSLAYNDLFELDLSTGEWDELHGGGVSAPFTRMHPHLQYDSSRDRLILFGGHTDLGDDNDVWAFPQGGDDWVLINEADRFTGVGVGCLNNSTEVPADYVEIDLSAPERRQKAFVTLMHDNLWVFGGMHAECSEHLDDTWRFDLESGSWQELIEARTGESCARRGDDCECLCL
ncbi:MAG: kelch repeat-containing protein [Myxococcota bacterium]|nr:kelch repeat-containing protein [Myxococcota bacterium]